MTLGSVIAGVSLCLLSFVAGRIGLFFAILLAEGAGMFVLYNVAFASVARLAVGIPAQRSISVITLFGGAQNDQTQRSTADSPDWPELQGAARKRGMLWMVISFVFLGYIMGAVMTLWVTNIQDLGHTAAMAALAGAVIGPFKTVVRFFEMLVSRNMYPLVTYVLALGLMLTGFAILLSFGFSLVGVIFAAALYGMGDGIKTIARGTLPLALFGAKGYGARLGWISFVQMGINASAPFVFAWTTQTYGGWWSFLAMTMCLCAAIATYVLIPDPRRLN